MSAAVEYNASRSIQLVASGESCPWSGEWEVVGRGRSRCIVSRGQDMPLYGGCIVLWRLLQIG